MMLAGGIVESGRGDGAVSAYVVYSAGHASRLFKVKGPSKGAVITELPAATTIDLGRFRGELEEDLAPALAELRAVGASPAVAVPSSTWVCGLVREHLRTREGIEVT